MISNLGRREVVFFWTNEPQRSLFCSFIFLILFVLLKKESLQNGTLTVFKPNQQNKVGEYYLYLYMSYLRPWCRPVEVSFCFTQMEYKQLLFKHLDQCNNSSNGWNDENVSWATVLAWQQSDCYSVLWHSHLTRRSVRHILDHIKTLVKLYDLLPDYKLNVATDNCLVYRSSSASEGERRVDFEYVADRADTGYGIQFQYSFFHPKSRILQEIFPFLSDELAPYTWIFDESNRILKRFNPSAIQKTDENEDCQKTRI
jgi:hypothetical protein